VQEAGPAGGGALQSGTLTVEQPMTASLPRLIKPRVLGTVPIGSPYSTKLASGTTNIEAAYPGDSSHLASTSPVCAITTSWPTNVQLIAPSTVSRTGTFTLTANVTAVGNGAPTNLNGSVTLWSNSIGLAQQIPIVNGTGSVTIPGSALNAGNKQISTKFIPAPATPQMLEQGSGNWPTIVAQ
jgi:hypothetical protein